MGALPVLGARAQSGRSAPEFTTIDAWLNTPAPLILAGLRGRVVLVDFWTNSCINCRRTVNGPLPEPLAGRVWARGLQVIGVHTPEFGFEHMRHNVEDAVREFGIRFPVAQDNGFRTWHAWNNQAWPAFYLLDRDGNIVLICEGEGHAHEMEAAIRALLGLAPFNAMRGNDADLSQIQTNEIYFGAIHPTPQDRAQRPRQGEAQYAFPVRRPAPGEYQLDGVWERAGEGLVLRSAHGGLRVRFSAAKLHLVAAAPNPATVRLSVDGQAAPRSRSSDQRSTRCWTARSMASTCSTSRRTRRACPCSARPSGDAPALAAAYRTGAHQQRLGPPNPAGDSEAEDGDRVGRGDEQRAGRVERFDVGAFEHPSWMTITAGRLTWNRARSTGSRRGPAAIAMVASSNSQDSTRSNTPPGVCSNRIAPISPPTKVTISVGRTGRPQTRPMPRW